MSKQAPLTDQATEVERAVAKGKEDRLKAIKGRQDEVATTSNLFWIVLAVGIVAVGVLAIAAIKYWL